MYNVHVHIYKHLTYGQKVKIEFYYKVIYRFVNLPKNKKNRN